MTTANGSFTFCSNGDFAFNYDCTGPSCWGTVFFPDSTCTSNDDASVVSCTNGVKCCGSPIYNSNFSLVEVNDHIVNTLSTVVGPPALEPCNDTTAHATSTPWAGENLGKGNSSASPPGCTACDNSTLLRPPPTGKGVFGSPTPSPFAGMAASSSKVGRATLFFMVFLVMVQFIPLAQAATSELRQPNDAALAERFAPLAERAPFDVVTASNPAPLKRAVLNNANFLNYLTDSVVTLYTNGFNYWFATRTGKPPPLPLDYWKAMLTMGIDAICQTGAYNLVLEKTALGGAITECATAIAATIGPEAAVIGAATGGAAVPFEVAAYIAGNLICNIIVTHLPVVKAPSDFLTQVCNVAHGDLPWPLPDYTSPPPYTPGLTAAKPPADIFNVPVSCLPPSGVCSSTCVNLLTDPKNCGSCGKTCPSKACTNGICTSSSCTGKTCSTYTACGPGGNCVCATTTSGHGFCADGSTSCGGLPDCKIDSDCAKGTVCAQSSCCNRSVCIGPTFCGGDATGKRGLGVQEREWINNTFASPGFWVD